MSTNDQHATPHAALELLKVGDIAGHFLVPRYQRGYRWGRVEVERLLEDLWRSLGENYSLQPIVVKRRGEGEWELVDGQQRLTTIYLIFLYMKREGLQGDGPRYVMTYETRPDSETYLRELDPEQRELNIDFFHIYGAYERIGQWFDKHEHRRQNAANKIYEHLFDRVRVIWYEAPAEVDSTTLFTRLNVGRIPLTDAELVKALLLSKSGRTDGAPDRAQEVAAQWDRIERDLRSPDMWAFVTPAREAEAPTRISLLLDTLAGSPKDRTRPRFHTFDVLRERLEHEKPSDVWEDVLDLHALLTGWYEDRHLFHGIGYLVAVGSKFDELVQLARGQTKSAFRALLNQRIRDSLNVRGSEIDELGYESHGEKCRRLLLLMNVETVRRVQDSSERYSFRRHGKGKWSLEHIHAQNAESLNKVEQWSEWLRLHRDALVTFNGIDEERRTALLAKLDAALGDVRRARFLSIASEITEAFTPADTGDGQARSAHSITNLALLASDDNSALNNAVFEVKRQRILELDRTGAYIPICTRQVFLKYYTEAGAQQIHFWGPRDRECYLDAMRDVLGPYLQPEEATP